MNRPDFSDYVAHFTKDGDLCIRDPGDLSVPSAEIRKMSAKDRLISILESKRILSTLLPWVRRKGVCFTECPWASLVSHANHYSPYGLGFEKPRLFAAGGGPAYYVRADHYNMQQWDPKLHSFVTPFWPPYRPDAKQTYDLNGKTIDYSHEREWRVPHDFYFEYDQVSFVIVKNYDDLAKFPKEIKDSIGRDRFILMDMYRQIEDLWPVHKL